jgi:hypothetical protein
MTDMSNLSWSSHEQVRSESEYNTRMKLAEEIEAFIMRSSERGLNNHFISGMELAKGIVLGLTKSPGDTEALDSNTLF